MPSPLKTAILWAGGVAFGVAIVDAASERGEELERDSMPLEGPPVLPPPPPPAGDVRLPELSSFEAELARLKRSVELEALPPSGWWRPATRKLQKIRHRRVPASRVCYRTKRDLLTAFMSHNQRVIDNFGGEDARHRPSEFDAVSVNLGLTGKQRPTTIAQAVWLTIQGGPPWCMEDIDVDLLNRTAAGQASTTGFTLPDEAIEKMNERREREHLFEQAELISPDDEVPF